jgi:hypothetical protein
MVMQEKKATFQRMGSDGKGKTENRCNVSGAYQSAQSYISTVSTARRVSG